MSSICACAYAITSITVTVLSIVTYVLLREPEYTYLTKLGINWKQGPIMELNTGSQGCIGNNETPLISEPWPGTVHGCDCPVSHLFTQGHCNWKEEDYPDCRNVYPTLPVSFTLWRGINFCGVRMAKTYFDQILTDSEFTCPTGTRPCGIADAFKSILCIET